MSDTTPNISALSKKEGCLGKSAMARQRQFLLPKKRELTDPMERFGQLQAIRQAASNNSRRGQK